MFSILAYLPLKLHASQANICFKNIKFPKWHFSAHEVFLLMFQNGLDGKDAIFVIVPL